MATVQEFDENSDSSFNMDDYLIFKRLNGQPDRHDSVPIPGNSMSVQNLQGSSENTNSSFDIDDVLFKSPTNQQAYNEILNELRSTTGGNFNVMGTGVST